MGGCRLGASVCGRALLQPAGHATQLLCPAARQLSGQACLPACLPAGLPAACRPSPDGWVCLVGAAIDGVDAVGEQLHILLVQLQCREGSMMAIDAQLKALAAFSPHSGLTNPPLHPQPQPAPASFLRSPLQIYLHSPPRPFPALPSPPLPSLTSMAWGFVKNWDLTSSQLGAWPPQVVFTPANLQAGQGGPAVRWDAATTEVSC